MHCVLGFEMLSPLDGSFGLHGLLDVNVCGVLVSVRLLWTKGAYIRGLEI